jgi:hypothetical protein
MSFRANRTAPRLLLLTGGVLVLALLLGACGTQETVVDGEQRTFEITGPELVVDTDSSSVTLVPVADLSGEVRVTRWFKAARVRGRTDITWQQDGETLKLRVVCRGIVTSCSARHEIEVPADLPVRLTSRNGPVRADGFGAGLDLTSHNGEISVSGAAGPLTLASHNGRVTATDVTTDRVRATSHNGAIRLELATAPAEVTAKSHNGGISVQLPGEASYQVDAEAKNGQVDVTVDQGGDAHRVSARSHNGSITVRPAGS